MKRACVGSKVKCDRPRPPSSVFGVVHGSMRRVPRCMVVCVVRDAMLGRVLDERRKSHWMRRTRGQPLVRSWERTGHPRKEATNWEIKSTISTGREAQSPVPLRHSIHMERMAERMGEGYNMCRQGRHWAPKAAIWSAWASKMDMYCPKDGETNAEGERPGIFASTRTIMAWMWPRSPSVA